MTGFLLELALFAVKAVIVIAGSAFLISLLLSPLRGLRGSGQGRLVVTSVRDAIEEARDAVRVSGLSQKEYKKFHKDKQKQLKAASEEPEQIAYVLDFDGDLTASAVGGLRMLITTVIGLAEFGDEVVLRLESPGGLVPHYGLAASQLARLRAKGIPVTVCVDKIAASGGYLMACEADHVVAAPFAVIGSIGVIAQVPNLNRLLERAGVDYEEVTAGRFKRTVSLLGKISEEGRTKFREQIEETHQLFKDAVQANRTELAIDEVATGEYWFGTRALELKLVDAIETSDDVILAKLKTHRVLHLEFEAEASLRERFGLFASAWVDRLWSRIMQRVLEARYT